eukprot:g9004.t1
MAGRRTGGTTPDGSQAGDTNSSEQIDSMRSEISSLTQQMGQLMQMVGGLAARIEEKSGGATEGAAESGGAVESVATSPAGHFGTVQQYSGSMPQAADLRRESGPSGRHSGEAGGSDPQEGLYDPESSMQPTDELKSLTSKKIPVTENPQHALNSMLATAESLSKRGLDVNETFVLHLFLDALSNEYAMTKHALRHKERLTRSDVLKEVTIEYRSIMEKVKAGKGKGARGAEQAYLADGGGRRGRSSWRGGGRRGRSSWRGRGGGRSGGRGGGDSSGKGGGGAEESKRSGSGGADGGGTADKKFPGRCFTCGRFGHTQQDCTTKESDYLPRCSQCAGWGHSKDKCATEEAVLAQIVHADSDVDSVDNQAFCAAPGLPGECGAVDLGLVGVTELGQDVMVYVADTAATCSMFRCANAFVNYRTTPENGEAARSAADGRTAAAMPRLFDVQGAAAASRRRRVGRGGREQAEHVPSRSSSSDRSSNSSSSSSSSSSSDCSSSSSSSSSSNSPGDDGGGSASGSAPGASGDGGDGGSQPGEDSEQLEEYTRPLRHGLERGLTRRETRELQGPEEPPGPAAETDAEQALLAEIIVDYVSNSLVRERYDEEQVNIEYRREMHELLYGTEMQEEAFGAEAGDNGSSQPLHDPQLSIPSPYGKKPSDVECVPVTYKDECAIFAGIEPSVLKERICVVPKELSGDERGLSDDERGLSDEDESTLDDNSAYPAEPMNSGLANLGSDLRAGLGAIGAAAAVEIAGVHSEVRGVKRDIESVRESVEECRAENMEFFEIFTASLKAVQHGIEIMRSAPLEQAEMPLKDFEASGGDVGFLKDARSQAMAAFVQGHCLDVKLNAAMIAISAGYVYTSKTGSPGDAKHFTVNGTLSNIIRHLAPTWTHPSAIATADGKKILSFLLNLVACVCVLPSETTPVLPKLDKRLLPAFGALCAADPELRAMYPAVAGVAVSAMLETKTMKGLFQLAEEVDVGVDTCISKYAVVQALLVSGKSLVLSPHGATSDRAALEVLFDATGGPSWKTNAGWGTSAPIGEWYGVTVDGVGRVLKLKLQQNNLNGPIPSSLGNLRALTKLDLSWTQLTGKLHEIRTEIKSQEPSQQKQTSRNDPPKSTNPVNDAHFVC